MANGNHAPSVQQSQSPPTEQKAAFAEMWKQGAIQLAVVVVAMLGFWIVEGREYVTRAEVSEMISRESPYSNDRSMILQSIGDASEDRKQLTSAIRSLEQVVVELKTILKERDDRNNRATPPL